MEIDRRSVAKAIYRSCHTNWNGSIPLSVDAKYDRMAESAIQEIMSQLKGQM